jgi:hypothetical protein
MNVSITAIPQWRIAVQNYFLKLKYFYLKDIKIIINFSESKKIYNLFNGQLKLSEKIK